jgi:hypothetical protein
VAFLRDQVQRQQEIIAQQAVTMRQLTAAPQESSEDAETVEEASEGTGSHSAAEEAGDEFGAERARREVAETTMREGMSEERRRREEAERERDDLRRELYARREPRESPETVGEQQDREESHTDVPGSQGGARRPWWRRVFRG